MTKQLRSRKRMLAISAVQSRLAVRNHADTQKKIQRLENTREQLDQMAGQMLDVGDCSHSGALAARFEFGHRLISLEMRQTMELEETSCVAEELEQAMRQSNHKQDFAARNLRQARKEHQRFIEQKQFHQAEARRYREEYLAEGNKP